MVNPIRLPPSRHDPGVVAGDEDDLRDARRLELVQVVDVRLDVALLARGREGPRDGDEDHRLARLLELLARVELDGDPAGVSRRRGRPGEFHVGREGGGFLDSSHFYFFVGDLGRFDMSGGNVR